MIEWFLVVVLATNTSGLVPVTRHGTRAACEQQMAVEVLHAETNRRLVASADCFAQRIPRLKPMTGEVLR